MVAVPGYYEIRPEEGLLSAEPGPSSSFMPSLTQQSHWASPRARLSTPGSAAGTEGQVGMSSPSPIVPASKKGLMRKQEREEDRIRPQFGGRCSIYFLTRNSHSTG